MLIWERDRVHEEWRGEDEEQGHKIMRDALEKIRWSGKCEEIGGF